MARPHISPNQREILYVTDSITGNATYVTATNNKLDVNATASLAGSALPIAGATTAVGVAIVDGSGNQITSFGGGSQYTDGAATIAHPIGTIPVFDNAGTITAVSATNPLPVSATISTAGLATSAKQDTGNSSLASIDGKIVAVNTGAVVVASSALPTGASTSAKQPALGTAGTASVDVITVQGIASMTALKVEGSGVTQPVSGTVTANAGTNLNTSALALAATQTDKSQFTKLTDGTDTALITAAGELNTIATAQPGVDIGDVTINNASGAASVNIQDGGNSITVDGTVAVSTLPATFAEDAPHTTGDLGVQVLTKRTDTAATSAGADGDYATFNSDSTGRLWVRVGGTDSLTPGTAAFNLGKAEDAAHASGDTGVAIWGVRNDTLASSTSASGDYSQVSTDQAGVVITAGAPRALKGRQATTVTSSTAETTIVTAVASTFLDLYGLILANTSATATKVSVRDATAGGTISVLQVPAGDTRGFMLPLDSAVPQAAVNNNWTVQCGTSVASLEVTALYVKRV